MPEWRKPVPIHTPADAPHPETKAPAVLEEQQGAAAAESADAAKEPAAGAAGAGSAPVYVAPLPRWAQVEEPATRGRRWLMWAAAIVLVVAVAAAGVMWYLMPRSTKPTLALWVTDLGGQLMIEWDRSSKPVQRALGGTIEIVDGGERVVIKMDADKLREGSVDYVRRSEMVDVRITVTLPGGATETDSVRFVGPPVSSERADKVLSERDALKAEVERLKAELEKARGGRIRPNAANTTP